MGDEEKEQKPAERSLEGGPERRLPDFRPRQPPQLGTRRPGGVPRSASEDIFSATKSAFPDGGTRTTISVPLAPDEKGFLDRQCPSEPCAYKFKVHAADVEKLRGRISYCPRCRAEAGSDNWKPWMTEAQREAATAHAVEHVRDLFHEALAKDFKKFNQSQRRGPFRISLNLKSRSKQKLPPVPSSEAFRLEIVCASCATRFAVLGTAFFCAGCGQSSVEQVFDQSLAKTKAKANAADAFADQLVRSGQPDVAADVRRDMVESGIADCVSALQHLCDSLWQRKNPTGKDPGNAFQNIEKGSALWRSFCGEGYEQWLTDAQVRRLRVFVQRRHLLEHCGGIVDADYIAKSQDTTYAVGRRIVVSVDDVVELVSLVEALACELRARLSAMP